MECVRCGQVATAGLLCADCVAPLVSTPPLCLEQVHMASGAELSPAGAGPALVDQWGRAWRLAGSLLVGRQSDGSGLSVLQASMSRHHARIEPCPSGWEVRDLGSSNGTFVNDEPVSKPRPLHSGDRLRFGTASFYFVERVPATAVAAPALAVRTFDPSAAESAGATGVGVSAGGPGLERRSIRVWEPSGGGGGLVDVDGAQIQLAATQFELLRLLVERMQADVESPAPVRGYVRTSELLASLSWDTRHPTDNHLKQLVRRLRRSLAVVGQDALIESRHGFGYRLSVLPTE